MDHALIAPSYYTGIDISPGMLAVARERWPGHTFIQADMVSLPLETASQDAVVSGFAAFNYVEDHRRVINEFYRVLKHGGRVWLNALGPRCLVRDTYALYVSGEQIPRYPVDADKLKRLFEDNGFENVGARAMTIVADRLPSWTPRWAANAFVRLESRSLGRLMPSSGDFVLLSAVKE